MSPFPDISFLYSLYREQRNSKEADEIFHRLREPLTVSSLLLLEFRQSVRFQIALHRHDRTKGFSKAEGDVMLGQLESDLLSGAITPAQTEWVDVYKIAERISGLHIVSGRHRLMDILHVATCVHLGAKEFLTFDENQRRLAQAEGLKVSL